MRKRSEVGAVLAEQLASGQITQPASPAADQNPGSGSAPGRSKGDLQMGALVFGLKELGFDVTLSDADKWSEEQLAQARRCLGTSGKETPLWLAAFHKNVPPATRIVEQQQAAPAASTAYECPPLFVSANRGPGLNPDMERIVETIYTIDAFRDYEELEQNLEVGEERGDYRTLMTHLDKAERRARRAHSLYLGAKLELVKWELDAKEVKAAMRQKVVESMQDEKVSGDRTKRITEADIDGEIRERFSDEFKAQELKTHTLKGAVEHLERAADLWKIRCHTLGTMLANLRK